MSYYGLTFETGVDRQQQPVTIISVNPEDGAAPRLAVRALRDGRLIVFPTEEGYLLGCNALDPRAIGRLCDVTGATQERKGRYYEDEGAVIALAERLTGKACPPEGAIAKRIGAVLKGNVVVQIIEKVFAHPVPLALMRAAGLPMVATAVPPGAAPAPVVQHMIFILGDAVDLVLNAGAVRREPVTSGR